MTAKNRSKMSSHANDKTPAVVQQDDAVKKSPKNAPGAAGPSALMNCISALFYLTLAGGAALAALYFQQVLSEVKVMTLKHEESMERYTEVARDVQRALQQISSVQESLEGLESAVAGVTDDLQSSSRAVQRGEADNRRLEETFQNLQNKILRDLTDSIQEVKDARERDVSSLERTLEGRLAQLSGSITEFSGEQSRYKNELQELKSHLEEHQKPALLIQELTSISSAVANLNTANEVSEGNMEVLREQIAGVRDELQTRNREVASVSEEIESVRSLMRSTVGAIREEVSAARSGTQAASDRVRALSDGLERSDEALQTLETQLRETLLKAERRGEDIEARLKAREESEDLSLTEQTNKLDALTAKYVSQQSSLQGYRTAAETLRDDVEEMKRSLSEAQVRLQEVELKLHGLAEVEGSEEARDLEITREETDESEMKTN